MENTLKTLFEFDEKGSLIFKAESLELPVIYETAEEAGGVTGFNQPLNLAADLPLAVSSPSVVRAPAIPLNLKKLLSNLASIVSQLLKMFLTALLRVALIPLETIGSLRIPKVNLHKLKARGLVSYFQGAGTVRLLGNGLILAGGLGLIISFYPIAFSQIAYFSKQLSKNPADNPAVLASDSGFGEIVEEKPKIVLPALSKEPLNKEFGIIIDKIDVNAPVVENVNSADYNAYIESLRQGAAHAAGTALPGQTTADGNNNVFIFAHSTLNLWDVPKYNAIFILLNKLESGDRISTFYKGYRYDYIVESKKIVDADDVKYLTEPSIDKILTLQTCDPPGTNLRRLIVTARIVNEEGQ